MTFLKQETQVNDQLNFDLYNHVYLSKWSWDYIHTMILRMNDIQIHGFPGTIGPVTAFNKGKTRSVQNLQAHIIVNHTLSTKTAHS